MAASTKEDKRASLGDIKTSPKRSSFISTGRGGAGNIGTDAEKALPPTVESLKTPTIKTEHFTTGRGGTGNMAYNHPAVPEMARASQDVAAPSLRRQESDNGQAVRHGRGGAANITKPEQDGVVVSTGGESRGRDQSGRRLSQGGWAEKGKEFLDNLRMRSKSKGRDLQ